MDAVLKIVIVGTVVVFGAVVYSDIRSESEMRAPLPPAAQAEPVDAATNRASCDEIRGTDYRSVEERDWFLQNCAGGAAAAPRQAVATCPVDAGVCDFARRLGGWLRNGDYGSIIAATRFSGYECTANEVGPGSAFQLCQGARRGEHRQGIDIFRRYSEGGVASPTQFTEFLKLTGSTAALQASDGYGSGQYRLVSVGCGPRLGPIPTPSARTCMDSFSEIFSGLTTLWHEPRLYREVLMFFVDGTGPGPVIYAAGSGVVLPEETDTILGSGGSVFDFGRVYPLR